MQLKTIDKNDYLYNRLDVKLYNGMVNSYNKETDFCKRLDIHNRSFPNDNVSAFLFHPFMMPITYLHQVVMVSTIHPFNGRIAFSMMLPHITWSIQHREFCFNQ